MRIFYILLFVVGLSFLHLLVRENPHFRHVPRDAEVPRALSRALEAPSAKALANLEIETPSPKAVVVEEAHLRRTPAPKAFVEETAPEVSKPLVAICAPTRSKDWKTVEETALHQLLVPSIEKSITSKERSKYAFRLYLAANHDDAFWRAHRIETPSWLPVSLNFYEVSPHKIPFNPMMRQAYEDGAEYFVRINDDSQFVSSGWVEKGILKLAAYDPPNLGVVGPDCREGNTAIMTHDMVHRTHLDVFDTYYPEVFSAWWVDDWISKVYGARTTKMMDWRVRHHTHKHGRRYEVQHQEKQLLKGELEKGEKRILEWLQYRIHPKCKATIHEARNDAKSGKVQLYLDPTQSARFLHKMIANGCQTMVARTQQMHTFPANMKSAGYYGPTTNKAIVRYKDVHNKGIEASNVMALFNWPAWKKQFERFDTHCSTCVGISSHVLYPSCLKGNTAGESDFSWITALKGKTVLVVTPWVSSVSANYANRALIWQNGGYQNTSEECLPTFKAIKTVRTHLPQAKESVTWFEQVGLLEQRIKAVGYFDVALLGCGAYGMAVFPYIKALSFHPSAIYVGGALQLWFGIQGERWHREGYTSWAKHFNTHWTWPEDKELQGSVFVHVEDNSYIKKGGFTKTDESSLESDEWTVALTVSRGFDDMFRNWWHWYSKLLLNMPVVVIAEDEFTYNAYKDSKAWTTWKTSFDAHPPADALHYNTKHYKNLVSRRAAHVLRALQKYPNVIYTDVDTVWLDDPRPYLRGDFDLWAQLDAKEYYCTGFMAFRRSPKVLQFLDLWAEHLSKKPQLNQPLFNKELQSVRIRHAGLPRKEFPSGDLYFDRGQRQGVVVVHNNFIVGKDKKVQRFKDVGLWHRTNWQGVLHLGSPPWSRRELRTNFQDFKQHYAFANNKGGMRLPHQYAIFSILNNLRPTTVIESGVWRGKTTQLIRKVLPQAHIISLDPSCNFKHQAHNHTIFCGKNFKDLKDLGALWRTLNMSSALLILDDHQSGFERLILAKSFGFIHLVTEDNHPFGTADNYALKQLWMEPETETVTVLNNFGRSRKTIPSWKHAANRRLALSALEIYAEFPPLNRDKTIDWFRNYNFPRNPYTSKPRTVLATMVIEGLNIPCTVEDEFAYHFIAYCKLSA